jgi:hypothetical protein
VAPDNEPRDYANAILVAKETETGKIKPSKLPLRFLPDDEPPPLSADMSASLRFALPQVCSRRCIAPVGPDPFLAFLVPG